jgi:hypothetical protein
MQLANFGNIPRKQSKFENFVKNSLKLTDLHIIGELWESFTGKAKANDSKLKSGQSEQDILGGEHTSQFQLRKRKLSSASEQPRKKQRDHVQAEEEDKDELDMSALPSQ